MQWIYVTTDFYRLHKANILNDYMLQPFNEGFLKYLFPCGNVPVVLRAMLLSNSNDSAEIGSF